MLANRSREEVLQIAAQTRALRVAEDEACSLEQSCSRPAPYLRQDQVPEYMARMGPGLERQAERMLSSRDARARPRPHSPPNDDAQHDDAEAESPHLRSRHKAADEAHEPQTPQEEEEAQQPRSPSPMSAAGESEKVPMSPLPSRSPPSPRSPSPSACTYACAYMDLMYRCICAYIAEPLCIRQALPVNAASARAHGQRGSGACVRTHSHARTRIRSRARTYARTHARTRARTHARAHTHTHTHAHTHTS